jgi:formylglycine-generating enzyme required for sulfatase activity
MRPQRYTRRALAFACVCALVGCATVPTGGPAAFRDCPDCPEMVVLPAGRYVMGTTGQDPDRWDDVRESPAHEVTLRHAFAMARHEVTRVEFARFSAETGHVSSGCNAWSGEVWVHYTARSWLDPGFQQGWEHPVVCVSWDDAKAFAAWMSGRTGASYRLPSEAEWEYAARAGTASSRFWGNQVEPGCDYANIGDRAMNRALPMGAVAACDDGHVYTAPVATYRPNGFGLYDMLGNAWEWTEDCWHPGYQGAPADGSARLEGDCSVRVSRGASWSSHYRNVRSANRGSYRAAGRWDHTGFRVVRDLRD